MLPKGMEMAAELRYLPPRRLMLASAAPAASIGDNGMQMNHEPFGTEAKFDTNMVIILAALLCALVCALGLNSIVRCALRCGGRFPFETPEETAARLASTGLKKSALRRIPIAVFGTATEILATECPICLGEFTQGDKVRLLPKCHHGFHVSCIDTWLLSHSSCPTCRTSLLEHTPPSHSGGANANANANPPPSV